MYIYQGSLWCDDCGQSIKARINAEGNAPSNPADEYSFDSDEYPKYANEDSSETDSPSHCAADSDCLNAEDLTLWGLPPSASLYGMEAYLIGALLAEGLTSYGVEYLRDMLSESLRTPYQEALHKLWRNRFADYLDSEPDTDDFVDFDKLNAARRNAGLPPIDTLGNG